MSRNANSSNPASQSLQRTQSEQPNERSQATRAMTRAEAEQEKKDIELAQLLEMMGDWKPVIPDEVTDYYLQKSGFETEDLIVFVLLSAILLLSPYPFHHTLHRSAQYTVDKH